MQHPIRYLTQILRRDAAKCPADDIEGLRIGNNIQELVYMGL